MSGSMRQRNSLAPPSPPRLEVPSPSMQRSRSPRQRGGSDSPTFGEDLFYCLLCSDSFKNPKLLDCQHAFCEDCLQGYLDTFKGIRYELQSVCIPCPTCRKMTKIPSEGLAGLNCNQQDDEKITQLGRKMSAITTGMVQRCDVCVFKNKLEESEYYCSKCAMNLCSACKTLHNQHSLFKSHPVIHISNKETINLLCDTHDKLPSVYFCLDCKHPICMVCVLHEHASHGTVKLIDALSMQRDNVKTMLNELGPRLDKMEARLKKLAFLHSASQPKQRNNGMNRSMSETIEQTPLLSPDVRKFSVFEKLNKVEEQMDLQVFYCQLEKLRKFYDFCAKVLEMSQSKKFLAIYEEIVSRLQSVMDIEVKFISEAVDHILDEKEGSMHEYLKQMASQTNGSGQLLMERFNSLSSTDSTSSLEDAFVFDKPQQSLLIKPKDLWKVEKQKHQPGDLCNPCDVAFMPNGNVVVAEYDNTNSQNNRLQIFNSDGQATESIGQGQVHPLGVTLTREGNIATTDCQGKRVKVFSPSGQLLCEWGKGQFGWPYGIVVNSKGQFIISDAFNDTISIHQPDGKKIKHFGTSGSGSSQFRNPYHIAVDANDNIIVSDCGNHTFKVFDSSGQYMFRNSVIRSQSSDFRLEGKTKKRRLCGPRGICVDLKGNILVADDNSRVCMFDSYGKYVRNILTEEDSVKYPEGLATNSSGNLVVTEWNPNNMFAVKAFCLYE